MTCSGGYGAGHGTGFSWDFLGIDFNGIVDLGSSWNILGITAVQLRSSGLELSKHVIRSS